MYTKKIFCFYTSNLKYKNNDNITCIQRKSAIHCRLNIKPFLSICSVECSHRARPWRQQSVVDMFWKMSGQNGEENHLGTIKVSPALHFTRWFIALLTNGTGGTNQFMSRDQSELNASTPKNQDFNIVN